MFSHLDLPKLSDESIQGGKFGDDMSLNLNSVPQMTSIVEDPERDNTLNEIIVRQSVLPGLSFFKPVLNEEVSELESVEEIKSVITSMQEVVNENSAELSPEDQILNYLSTTSFASEELHEEYEIQEGVEDALAQYLSIEIMKSQDKTEDKTVEEEEKHVEEEEINFVGENETQDEERFSVVIEDEGSYDRNSVMPIVEQNVEKSESLQNLEKLKDATQYVKEVTHFEPTDKLDDEISVFSIEASQRLEEIANQNRIIEIGAPTDDLSMIINYSLDTLDPDEDSEYDFSKYYHYPEDEEKAEEEEVKEIIDRDIYYAIYNNARKQLEWEDLLNKCLSARMANWYLKRKMYYAFQEDEADAEKKYRKALYQFNEVFQIESRQRQDLEMEIGSLSEKKRATNRAINKKYDKLLKMQDKVMRDIINLRLNDKADKIMERLLKRQNSQIANLSNVWLTYIKIRNKFTEADAAINKLIYKFPGYNLIEYEETSEQNKILREKIEKKDNILLDFRENCKNALLNLAHRKKKTASVEEDFRKLALLLGDLELDFQEMREKLRDLKCEKELIREETTKMQEDANFVGPNVWMDIKNSDEEKKRLEGMERFIRTEFESTTRQIRNVRKHIEVNNERRMLENEKLRANEANLGRKTISEKKRSGISKTINLKFSKCFDKVGYF